MHTAAACLTAPTPRLQAFINTSLERDARREKARQPFCHCPRSLLLLLALPQHGDKQEQQQQEAPVKAIPARAAEPVPLSSLCLRSLPHPALKAALITLRHRAPSQQPQQTQRESQSHQPKSLPRALFDQTLSGLCCRARDTRWECNLQEHLPFHSKPAA